MRRAGVGVLGVLVALGAAAAPAQASGALHQQRTWSAVQADVPAARAAGHDGDGVVVAVLDTWVDRTHPDFQGRVLAGADCLGGPCRPGQRSDACDHGTHVAGTVTSSSFGVAPRARVLPVRVLSYDRRSGDCIGRPADVAAGIRYAVDSGARILNLSLGADVPGSGTSPVIGQAVAEAAARGALVVFSAGNDDLPVADSYGGYAVVVAATGPRRRLASYSQHGKGITLAAPGGDPVRAGRCTPQDCVTSLFPRGRYAVAAGTSMAAPLVSGVAALLLSQQPGRTRAELTRLLTATARPLAGGGAGVVDAAAALGVRPAVRRTPAPTRKPAPVAATDVHRKAASPVPRPSSRARRPSTVEASPVSQEAAVPTGLAGLAGALVVLAGAGALVAGRRRV